MQPFQWQVIELPFLLCDHQCRLIMVCWIVPFSSSFLFIYFISVSSRMIEVQSQMAERTLELLALPSHPCFLLDIGCGSGLSGEVLSEESHYWVGIDISTAMLGESRVGVSSIAPSKLFRSCPGDCETIVVLDLVSVG